MQAAIQESKTWIKRKAILTHNNKPVQIRVNLMNNSISESYLIIEDMPNSNCFIQISPEILVSYTYDNSFILYLQFVKYEHAILHGCNGCVYSQRCTMCYVNAEIIDGELYVPNGYCDSLKEKCIQLFKEN